MIGISENQTNEKPIEKIIGRVQTQSILLLTGVVNTRRNNKEVVFLPLPIGIQPFSR